MMRRPAFWRACAALLAIALTGCAGYQLGPPGGQAAGARSIQINPFANKTIEPRLADYLMISLRKNLIQDGTYRVDTHDDGDVILSGVITGYERKELSLQPNDVLTTLDYEITLTALITARDRASGKIIFERPVTGKTALRASPDYTSTERQAIPMLTDDLARRAVALLVNGSW